MNTKKNKFTHIILVTLVTFFVCSVLAMLVLDGVAQSLIQSNGSARLGVEVSMDSVHVGLFRKESNLRGLAIANPKGFLTEVTPTLLTVQDVDIEFGVLSILSGAIEIPTASISGITLNIEQIDSVSNIQALVNSVSSSSATAESNDEKLVTIETLVLKDITVIARGEFTIVDTGPVTAHIKEIVLHDLGTEGNTDVAVEAITTAVTQAIMRHLSEHPVEGISKLVVGNVTNLMNELPIIKELGLGSAVQSITDGVGKGVDDILGGIGGLLDGNN